MLGGARQGPGGQALRSVSIGDRPLKTPDRLESPDLGDTMKRPLLAVAATRVCVAAILTAISCVPASAQRIDYSKLEIKTTDLGHGVYLLGWQGGDSLILIGD